MVTLMLLRKTLLYGKIETAIMELAKIEVESVEVVMAAFGYLLTKQKEESQNPALLSWFLLSSRKFFIRIACLPLGRSESVGRICRSIHLRVSWSLRANH